MRCSMPGSLPEGRARIYARTTPVQSTHSVLLLLAVPSSRGLRGLLQRRLDVTSGARSNGVLLGSDCR